MQRDPHAGGAGGGRCLWVTFSRKWGRRILEPLASSSGICDLRSAVAKSPTVGRGNLELSAGRTRAAGWPSRMSKVRLKAAAPWRELRFPTPG